MAGEKEIEIEDQDKPITVSIDDDPVIEKKEQKEPAKEFKRPSVEEELEELRTGREAREKRARDAEAAAREAQGRAATAEQTTFDAQYGAFRAAHEAAAQQIEAAKQRYRSARESGDFDKESEENVNIARLVGDQRQLQNAIAEMDRAKEAFKQQQAQRQNQPQQQQDPVEQWLSTLDPKARGWMRDHPDCLPGQSRHNDLMRAVAGTNYYGIQVGSNKYYEFIENELSNNRKNYPDSYQESGQQRQSQRQPTAPPSRQAPTSSPNGRRSINLTPSEIDTAIQLGASLKLDRDAAIKMYAVNKQAAIDAGEL